MEVLSSASLKEMEVVCRMKTDLFMMPRAVKSNGEKEVCNLGYTLLVSTIDSLKSDQTFNSHGLKVVDVMILKTKYRSAHENARSVYGGIAYEK